MNNSLQALEAVRKLLSENKGIQLRETVKDADLQITNHLLRTYDFNGSFFFDKRTQQSITNLEREVFTAAKTLRFLESNSLVKFNHKYAAQWPETKADIAKTATREAINKFIDRKAIKLQGESYGNTDARGIVIAKILKSGFVAESDGKGGIQFRKLTTIEGARYWSKPFEGGKVINDFAAPFIDKDATELAQLEMENSLRAKARALFPDEVSDKTLKVSRQGNPKFDRALELYKKQQDDLRFQYTVGKDADVYTDDLLNEFKNVALWKEGVPTPRLATLDEERRAMGFAQSALDTLNTYEVPPVDEVDRVYTDYSRVRIVY